MNDIKQLKAANPIEVVAARYGTLHRSGANYKMLCPFHDDHHPSLGIHVGGQYFKCHACGAGGDVIGLVMGLEHCSFAEAVAKLGGKEERPAVSRSAPASVPVSDASPGSVSGMSPAPSPEAVAASARERARRIGANNGFLASLLPCASGHTELSGTWLDFGVGQATAFVPDDYRYLRGRIVFPVYNAEGELTGFGGRRQERTDANLPAAADDPKYVNSPNSLLFDKSRMLYGIHRASEAIRRKGFAYLTEGYKDALAMHAAGFTNTVALGGTAFTSGQAKELQRFCSRAVLLLDNDPAGQAATVRLLEEPPGGLSLGSLRLVSAKDPDELFRRLGREDFICYMELLTEMAGAGECRLLAFCLKHPAVAPHVERMLEEDDLVFTGETYRNLLRFVSLRQPLAVLPSRERMLAEILSGQLPDLPLPPGVPASMLSEPEETICPDLADYFRLEYYEERLLSDTSRLTEQLKTAPAETVGKTASASRTALLATLSSHISQLVRLTESLARTPVIEERWL